MKPEKLREFERHLFKAKANNPGAWFMTGLSLKLAADGLPTTDIDEGSHLDILRYGSHAPVWRFLIARSIENLIKGIIIARLSNPIGERIDKSLRTHNLTKLNDLAGIECDDKSRVLLNRLRPFCEWIGDYPVPVSAIEYKIEDTQSNFAHAELQHLWNFFARELFAVGWITANDGAKLSLWDYAGDALRRQLGELPRNY